MPPSDIGNRTPDAPEPRSSHWKNEDISVARPSFRCGDLSIHDRVGYNRKLQVPIEPAAVHRLLLRARRIAISSPSMKDDRSRGENGAL